MNKLVFAIALFLIVPALRAQQAETSGNPPQAAPQAAPETVPQQPAAQNPTAQDNLPASIRPGHPLDPADVDILTGKRDREIEAAQRAAVPYSAGMYVKNGAPSPIQGQIGRAIYSP